MKAKNTILLVISNLKEDIMIVKKMAVIIDLRTHFMASSMLKMEHFCMWETLKLKDKGALDIPKSSFQKVSVPLFNPAYPIGYNLML
ncbi:MAG TPA: hypothetical protein GXX49_04830 [Clostridiaceae bacterium]|nr:hypothetical protein [Clostridiaceae bacterium]